MSMETLTKAVREQISADDDEEWEGTMHDVARGGADAGWPGFTYTRDCVKFYEENETDILNLATDMASELGHANVAEMVAGFGRADMLDGDGGWANLLAWFALEEVARSVDPDWYHHWAHGLAGVRFPGRPRTT